MLETLTTKGDGIINEDIFGYRSERFWVLDGATSIHTTNFFPAKSDAQFLVSEFSKIVYQLAERDSLTNKELLNNAMILFRERFPLPFLDKDNIKYQPSFAMAMAKIERDFIYVNILSDCYVVLEMSRKIEVYTDNRIQNIAYKTKKVKEYIVSNKIDNFKAKELLLNQIEKNRMMMNVDNGYWVGTADGIAFNNMISHKISINGIKSILICTDGFYKVFQLGLISLLEFFNNKISLSEANKVLRNYERKNTTNGDLKKSDDATAIHIIS